MLIGLCSAKGSPGSSSLALSLAAAWPDQVTLLEADPSGTDLAFRCRHASGREVASTPNILGLAAAVRGSSLEDVTDPTVLAQYAQPLACGVSIVPGVTTPGQARGLGSLWGQLAHAAVGATGDVIADLGRIDRTAPTTQVAGVASVLVVVCQPTLESVVHTRELIKEIAPALPGVPGGRRIMAAVVAPPRQMTHDAADVDQILFETSLPVEATAAVAYDSRALRDLEAGANPRGRLARSPLMRSVQQLVDRLNAHADGDIGEAVGRRGVATPEAGNR